MMVAAVLVGLANAALYSMVGDEGPEEPLPGNSSRGHSHPVCGFGDHGGALGIRRIPELRFVRRDLQGSFFARYGLVVLALCIGGVELSLLTVVTGSLDDGA